MESPVTVEAALLQALLRGPSFGAELAARVAVATGGVVRVHPGMLYQRLRAMAGAGLIAPAAAPAGLRHHGLLRRYYALTARGAAVAARHRRALAGLAAALAARPPGDLVEPPSPAA